MTPVGEDAIIKSNPAGLWVDGFARLQCQIRCAVIRLRDRSSGRRMERRNGAAFCGETVPAERADRLCRQRPLFGRLCRSGPPSMTEAVQCILAAVLNTKGKGIKRVLAGRSGRQEVQS